MSQDTEFHVHHDAPEVIGRRERLGVRLLIVADAAFVFGMIFSYFYLRNQNVNNGWLPQNHHHASAASSWLVAIPFVVTAVLHKVNERAGKVNQLATLIAFLSLVVGAYLQWHQLAHMTFLAKDPAGNTFFGSAYASNYVLFGGANMFHYLLGGFIALGLVLRARRIDTDPGLEKWRQRTAGSWFTWIAISAVLCALTTSII
jgi:heme/copper-type cytochrome/quinol oxidase subunit 3